MYNNFPTLGILNRIILEGPMHQEGDLGNFNQPFNSADPAVGLCADISSMSTDAEVFDLSKSDDSSSEVCHRKEPFHCQPTPGDLLPNNIDEKCDKTDDDISKSKKIVYSALEKLNNANYFNRKDEEKFNENVPDLKLKPTVSQIIKNDFELKNTPKKKKNRKRTKWDQDDVIYELQPKSAPCTGMQCVFSHIESPSEFYIHIVDEESVVIDLMTEQINEYFQGTVSDFESKEEICAYIVDYGLAFISEYNGWSRVRILDWDLESKCDEVLVQLVDFGNKRRVSYKNLRKMTKDLAQYPMLAVKCHLPLMYPPNSTFFNRLTAWPAETIDALVGLSGLFVLETAESQENKIFQIVYAAQEGDSVAIDMYNLQETTPEQTVGQILLDLRLAEQIVEEPDEENLEVEEFLQDVNTLGMVDNINEAIAGYDPRDEARICRFTKSNGTCYKGKNCKLEHIPLDKDGFTTDKEPVFREAMETLQLPANGDSVILLITGIKDACSFYAQIVKNIHKEKNRDQEYVIDIDFYTLLATMNNPKIGQSYEKFKIPPAIGEVVIAQHRYNRKWLRAVVRERLTWNDDESDEYQVYMVDFGDCLNLPRGALRKIKPHYLQLPFQAIECYIHNYRAKRNCDTKRTVAMSASLPLKVWIKTFNEFDIAKKLVENGFAEERKYDSNPQDGCLIELY
ncbi:hypothetical protein NQ317_013727 [Molorchus minor]|uniref:C3H1-type domain-containing protein n=1 Tax=Molorchus minor TaxID=1323400 RepID=A0ABQ9JPQ2_9CUCU|nr:hypothetical protein NQ317_013727 [Molorchus minor]